MNNSIFQGLEILGFEDIDGVDLYEEGNSLEVKQNAIIEKNSIYKKNFECPVCSGKFQDIVVRTAKQRLVSTDSDLRPIYQYFAPYKYEVLVCTHCGYSNLMKNFESISEHQIHLTKEGIGKKYKKTNYADIYDIDTAITRFKLALLNSLVRNAKAIEKAYLCLKIRWLYKDKIDILKKIDDCDDNELQELEKNKKNFTENALRGFIEAEGKNEYPAFGIDIITGVYLMGELSRLLGLDEQAKQWLGKVVISNGANRRIREKARTQRALISTQGK